MATWVALLALLLQTLVPLGQMLQAAEPDGAIYVCTPKGLVALGALTGQTGKVSLPQGPLQEAEQDPSQNKDGSHDEYAACQVCTAGLFGNGLTVVDMAISVPVADVSVGLGHDLMAWRGSQPRGSLPPRGPP